MHEKVAFNGSCIFTVQGVMGVKFLLRVTGIVMVLLLLLVSAIYLWYAVPMHDRFWELENRRSTTCAINQRWQVILPVNEIASFVQEANLLVNDLAAISLIRQELVSRNISRSEVHLQNLIVHLEFRRRYSKKQRNHFILRHAYWGQSGRCAVFGVEAAAQHYFAKTTRQLSIAETALLVGLSKGASYFSPFRFPERALKRRDAVLTIFHKAGVVSDSEYQTALREPLTNRGVH